MNDLQNIVTILLVARKLPFPSYKGSWFNQIIELQPHLFRLGLSPGSLEIFIVLGQTKITMAW